ncbi:MAG: hypothetical protein GY870_11640 [archaeon]|nr:hypothetical protein [archaeon]
MEINHIQREKLSKFSVIDGHIDTVLALSYQRRSFSKGNDKGKGHVDLPRMKEGNVQAALFAVFPGMKKFLLKMFEKKWFKLVNNSENELMHIKSYEDFAIAKEEGKKGAVLHFEGVGGFDEDLNFLRSSAEKGLRTMGITWALDNKFGTSAKFKKEQPITGLTELGKKLTNEAQSLGITIDASHLSEKSFWDLIDITDKPIIVSHSNTKAVSDHPRNLTDEQIRAVHTKKGTIGINLWTALLDKEKNDKEEKFSLSIIKEHLDHIIKIADINTIALGSDFDGAHTPECMKDCSYYPSLFSYLLENGYSESDLEKLSHGNLLRVFKETWK